MVGPTLAEPSEDLHDRRAHLAQAIDQTRVGTFGRAKKQAINPMLAHARDEPLLPARRLSSVSKEGHETPPVEHLVNASGQFRIEGVGDFADNEADRMGRS
jgi:hypothetical protein